MIILSLGTNLGNLHQNLETAVDEISQFATITARSNDLCTEPWGFDSANSFLNEVVTVECELDPLELLAACKKVERKMGRMPQDKHAGYQDRLIDIDLIAYGDKVMDTEDLVLPHPLMHLRDFVLIPLCEIQPSWMHPTLNESAQELCNKVC